MSCRTGEHEKTWFRSNRFYNAESSWFFTTREGLEMGPFDNRKEAEAELNLFIRHVNDSLYGYQYIRH